MTIKELEHIVTSHLIESAGFNQSFKEGLKSLNSKMNWVLGLIASCFLVLLTAYLRGH